MINIINIIIIVYKIISHHNYRYVIEIKLEIEINKLQVTT